MAELAKQAGKAIQVIMTTATGDGQTDLVTIADDPRVSLVGYDGLERVSKILELQGYAMLFDGPNGLAVQLTESGEALAQTMKGEV